MELVGPRRTDGALHVESSSARRGQLGGGTGCPIDLVHVRPRFAADFPCAGPGCGLRYLILAASVVFGRAQVDGPVSCGGAYQSQRLSLIEGDPCRLREVPLRSAVDPLLAFVSVHRGSGGHSNRCGTTKRTLPSRARRIAG